MQMIFKPILQCIFQRFTLTFNLPLKFDIQYHEIECVKFLYIKKKLEMISVWKCVKNRRERENDDNAYYIRVL